MNKTLKLKIDDLEKKEIEIINKYDLNLITRTKMLIIIYQISKEIRRLKKLKREFGENYIENNLNLK